MKKTQKITKKIITETVDNISPYEFEISLSDLKDKIEELIKEYGPEARLDWNRYFHYQYDSEPSPRFDVKRDREETDNEYLTRIGIEEANRLARESKDREEYERLRKQFEGK